MPLTLRLQAGYDHSYFFIATFIEEHLRFHARTCERASAAPRYARRAPEALAVCVAIASISGGDRQS